MTICGCQPNDADCMYCLVLKKCRAEEIERKERQELVSAYITNFTKLHGKEA